jgi:hypothetical protein
MSHRTRTAWDCEFGEAHRTSSCLTAACKQRLYQLAFLAWPPPPPSVCGRFASLNEARRQHLSSDGCIRDGNQRPRVSRLHPAARDDVIA